MIKKIMTSILLLTLLSSQSVFAAFTDVSESDNYYQAINWLESQGVVEGYSDNSFRPYDAINRAEFLKMIYEIEGGTHWTSQGFDKFPDVIAEEWYAKYVRAGYEENIVDGYPDETFKPDSPINRAEAMKIVTRRYFNEEPLNFFSSLSAQERLAIEGCESNGHFLADIEAGSWFEPYFGFAHSKCLIAETMIGDNYPPLDDEIYPSRSLNRGEMAELIYRAKALKDSSADRYHIGLSPLDVE